MAKAGSRSFSKHQTRCAQLLRLGGRWKVVFATVDTQQESFKVYDAVKAAGYSAGIRPQGKYTYDVRLSQLPSKAQA